VFTEEEEEEDLLLLLCVLVTALVLLLEGVLDEVVERLDGRSFLEDCGGFSWSSESGSFAGALLDADWLKREGVGGGGGGGGLLTEETGRGVGAGKGGRSFTEVGGAGGGAGKAGFAAATTLLASMKSLRRELA